MPPPGKFPSFKVAVMFAIMHQKEVEKQELKLKRMAPIIGGFSPKKDLKLNMHEPKTRIFVSYEHERVVMDIPEGKTIAEVKIMVQDKFGIQANRAAIGELETANNVLVLSYCGAELGDDWILTDVGVLPGSTVRAYLKEELKPILFIYCAYSDETIQIIERMNLRKTTVGEVRGTVSRRIGLPVGIFRFVSEDGLEMYDIHTLDEYNVTPGATIRLETWDGWNDFINLAIMGFASHLMAKLSLDELVQRYQMKVALHIAAHFGHVDLASTLTKHGIRSDEPIGEHPYRQWCQKTRHVDSMKCPIHEATENGNLPIVRLFVSSNVCCVMAKDGNGLRPLNIALRKKQKGCASFLLTKQWSKVQCGSDSLPLSIFTKMKNWAGRSREKAILVHGTDKTTLKGRKLNEAPLVGQGIYVDGFSDCQMNTKPKAVTKADIEARRVLNLPPAHLEGFKEDPERYFRVQTKPRLPRMSRTSRNFAAKNKNLIEDEKEGVRLPPIDESGQRKNEEYIILPARTRRISRGSIGEGSIAASSPPGSPKSVKSMFFETGKSEASDKSSWLKDIPEKSKSDPEKKKSKSAKLLQQAKSTEGAIPLPMTSKDLIPKPYYHIQSNSADYAKMTLDQYEYHRGMNSRDYAIKCLSIANNFKEKPWLQQVRLAMLLSTQSVKKNTEKLDGAESTPRLETEAVGE